MTATTPATLRELLDAVAARGAEPAVLVVAPDGSIASLTAAGLASRAEAASLALLKTGVRPGEPVALLGPNSAAWIIGYFGILSAGAVPVPLDCQLPGSDLLGILARAGVRRALTTRPLGDLLRAGGATDLALTALEDLDAPDPGGGQPDTGLPLMPCLRPDDVAAMPFTSGTTGTPKAVPLTHRNLLSNVEALVAARLIDARDRVVLPLPLHHVYPFTCGLLGCLATGAALVLPAGVTGPSLVAAIRGTRATMLLGVPRLYTALLAGIEARATAGSLRGPVFRALLALSTWLGRYVGFRPGRWLFSRVHREMGETLRMLVSGGARLEPATAWRLEGLGWEVFSGYGLTETSPILTFNVRGQVRHDTAGRPLPGVQLRIAAPSPGVPGEIQAFGPNVFAGYRGEPDATAGSFTADGWFRTGDLGYLDKDGFLHVTGRVRETLVLPDGKKISPEEVEAAYGASPLVREAALLLHGGRLVALVVPDEANVRAHGAARAANLIREQLEAVAVRLPAYQRIVDYRLSHAPLPRTPMGKLQRFRLPALYAAQAEAATVASTPTLTDAERALRDSPLGQRLWPWLQERFPGKQLGMDASPQLDLGVDSLEWVTLTLEIRDRFGVALDQAAVARILTVRDLLAEVQAAALVGSGAAGTGPTVTPVALPSQGPGFRALGLVLYAINRLLMGWLFRLEVQGREHLPPAGPVLIAPNHASYLDPLAIAAALPWRLLPGTRWAGWSGIMFRAWHWRLLSRATGVFPVDPDREPAAAIRSGLEVLARDQALVWFPEGRRTLTGEMGPFLVGVGVLLATSGSRAVPVHIEGTWTALPWNRRWPRPGPVKVVFGPPLAAAELEALGTGATPAERIASGLRGVVAGLGSRPMR